MAFTAVPAALQADVLPNPPKTPQTCLQPRCCQLSLFLSLSPSSPPITRHLSACGGGTAAASKRAPVSAVTSRCRSHRLLVRWRRPGWHRRARRRASRTHGVGPAPGNRRRRLLRACLSAIFLLFLTSSLCFSP